MAALLGGIGAPHRPVLLKETLKFLVPERGGLFVDCTVGLGGHSEAILQSSAETRVVGMDLDPAALAYAQQRLSPFGDRFRAFQANFRELAVVLSRAGERDPSGILVDLGVSSLQFDSPVASQECGSNRRRRGARVSDVSGSLGTRQVPSPHARGSLYGRRRSSDCSTWYLA